MILVYFLIAFLTCYALQNHFQVLRGISRFLWKRGTDAEEKAEQFEWLLRELFLREWGRQEVEKRKEEEKRYKEVEIGQSAEVLQRRIRLREVDEENKTRFAKCLAKEQQLEEVYEKLALNRDEEQQLQFQQEKLSRRIARKRDEHEELKHEQMRSFQGIKTMAVFLEQSQSMGEQLKEGVPEEEKPERNKEILARGNESRSAHEEQRRTTTEMEKGMVTAEEKSTRSVETDYDLDRGSPQFELSDTELDLELGLECATIDCL